MTKDRRACLLAYRCFDRLSTNGFLLNHLFNCNPVFIGKCKIALIVRGHTHHRTVAITHQHVIAHPHRHSFARERMLHCKPCIDAFFLLRSQLGLRRAALGAFGNKRSNRGVTSGGVGCQWMLRRNGAKRHAHNRVSAGGKNVHLTLPVLVLNQLTRCVFNVVREGKAHALAFAYPVFLH